MKINLAQAGGHARKLGSLGPSPGTAAARKDCVISVTRSGNQGF